MSLMLGIFPELISLSSTDNPQQPKPNLKPQETPFANTRAGVGVFVFLFQILKYKARQGFFTEKPDDVINIT